MTNSSRILFVGVFDRSKRSTNTSQLLSFKRLGHDVVGYNYRQKALEIGNEARDNHLIETVRNGNFDLVIYSKCNQVSESVFLEINKISKTCLWFMDPLLSYDNEMREKTALVDYFCCDKYNVLLEAKKINKNTTQICEGYDETVDKPYVLEKEYDVSFIGNIYGNREEIMKNINHNVNLFSNVYGSEHAKIVSKSWINLNFCTSEGASDRVYKIMAAGGFLLTNDWEGRAKNFVENEDLMIFQDTNDLNNKIESCLKNKMLLNKIAESGKRKVSQFNRINWAKKVINYCYDK